MNILINLNIFFSPFKKGKRKIHYTFEDKTEMAEEYNMQSGELLSKNAFFSIINNHINLNI